MRRAAAVMIGAGLLLGTGPCTPLESGEGFVSDEFRESQALAYLEFATAASTGSILNAIAHMERDLTDPDYTAPVGVVDENTWANSYRKIDKLLDTRDFDGLYLLNALLGYEGHPYLTPAAWDRVRTALLSFKMWYTDPTPPMPDPDFPLRDWDDSFYWTENHQILYHVIEYLAGLRFDQECFWISGFTPTADCTGPGEMYGHEHAARAKPKILDWLDDRFEAGFSEWLSLIYLQKDATPLLTLVEFGESDVAERAAMVLDALLMDMAVHTWRGSLGTTAGRSAMKDKRSGPTQDTWGITLQMFAQEESNEYASTGDPGATLFARAKRYRMPQVILEAARDDAPTVALTRQSFPIDERASGILDPGDPTFPAGQPSPFEDTEESFTFWWGLGAWTIWQVVPITVTNADRYNLWPTSLLQPFLPLRDLLGDPPSPQIGVQLAKILWPAAAVGLLKEANTYTWRRPEYMLSTVQDYRKGANAGQVHAWHAVFGNDAMVFTTHPMNPVQPPNEWVGADEGEPGYWTGTASMPRSAQHENVGIHIYSPLYPIDGLFGFFDYQEMTHAYFPQDHFDEVVQDGSWTFGRLGEAYIALYSWRPTVWQDYPQEEYDLLRPRADGSPITRSFDLQAPGGPDNVWIVECGTEEEWGSFEAFFDAVRSATVTVTPAPTPIVPIQTFDVAYESPSQGPVTFGWDAPFVVDGVEQPLADYPRMSHPWAEVPRGATVTQYQGEAAGVVHDWVAGERTVYSD